jgi:hypothetical protein
MHLAFRVVPIIIAAALLIVSHPTTIGQMGAELRPVSSAGDIAQMEHLALLGSPTVQEMLALMLAKRGGNSKAPQWRLQAAESGKVFTITNLALDAHRNSRLAVEGGLA